MIITNFASGELSPNLNGRVDIQQYYQGAARIENFEIIPTGGIKRRNGTRRLAAIGGNNRIIPFIVDKNLVYVLELGLNPDYDSHTEGSKPGIIRIWTKIVSGDFSVTNFTIYTDYSNLADIRELQYAQNYDTLVFTHRGYKPFIVKFTGTSFTGSEMQFDFWPDVELDDDYDFIMLPAYGFPEPTVNEGEFTYYAMIDGTAQLYTKKYPPEINDYFCIVSGKLYKQVNVGFGPEWRVYGQDTDIDSGLFGTVNKYPGCVAFFNNRLFFASTMEKPQMVYASAAPDSSQTRYNDFCTYKKYVTVNKVTKDADLHLFSCDLVKTNIDEEHHTTTFTNVTQDFTQEGILAANITKYFISGDIIPIGTKVLSATSNSITINTDKLNTVWGETETSKTNLVLTIQLWRTADSVSAEDYEYIVVSRNIATADCSLFFELASDQNDAIKFLSSNRFLAIGTESSIWSVDAGISALSVNAVMQGRYGSDDIQGQAIETATVYFAQGRKGIREFYYDGQNAAFRTNNIALLADHILRESKAVDFDYMTNPYSRLLIVREDGTLAEMLYDKSNGIMAWSRIVMTEGKIRSCAVTRGDDENDLILLTVEDNNTFYLELLDFNNDIYLDSWSVYNNRTGYTDDAILYNKTRQMTCPCNDIPEDFIEMGNEVYIGYPIRSYIKSMPVVGNNPSKKQIIKTLLVRFLDSYRPVVKCPGLPDEKFNSISEVPYSGIGKVTYPGVTDHDVSFELEAADVHPVTILSIDAQTA